MRTILATISTIAAALGLAAPGASAEGLSLGFGLTSDRPSSATGAFLHVVYPDNGPGGRPKPVREGLYEFPAGTSIDESAIPVCAASDTELELLGAGACPADTSLGGGGITVDTGLGEPIDPLALEDSYFHGPGQLITVFRPDGAPGPVVQVNRLEIEGSAIIDRPSLPPGYPIGTKTVAREVNQEITPVISPAGTPFITTPPRCPSDRAWVSRLTITYEDGSVESAASATACAR